MMNHSARLIFAAMLATAGHVGVFISGGQASAHSNANQLSSAMQFNLATLPQAKPSPPTQPQAAPPVVPVSKPTLATRVAEPLATEVKKNTTMKPAAKPSRPAASAQSKEKRVTSVVAKKNVDLVQEPRFKSLPPAPAYPRQARLRGQQGIVFIHAQLNAQGDVVKLRLEKSSGFPLLDRAALNAIQQWDFMPGVNADGDTRVWVEVPVQFVLTSNKVS